MNEFTFQEMPAALELYDYDCDDYSPDAEAGDFLPYSFAPDDCVELRF